jgi:hypothetical protein
VISFITKPNGTIQVKQKGTIYYKFKGMSMHPEPATVVEQDGDVLVVDREIDKQLVEFIKSNSSWLLKGNETPNSLLYGTCFRFDS